MALIGLDTGTSGCKCTVFGDDGRPVSHAYKEYDAQSPRPGWFELDSDVVWQSIREVIAGALNGSGGARIRAIAVSSIGEAVIPVDRAGRVLSGSILYTDSRGSEEAERLTRQFGGTNIFKMTGVKPHGMFSICRIMWYREHQPEIFAQADKYLLFEDFINYRLCGVAAVDHSLASRTMAFDPIGKRWQPALLEAAGISERSLSEPVPSGTRIGRIAASVASGLGLPADCEIVTGGHDQVCAAIGGGILHDGMALDGIGSVDCITPAFSALPDTAAMERGNYAVVPHAVGGMYVTYAYSLTAGTTLKWYRDNFAGKTAGAYAALDAAAPEEPTGLLLQPHFAGSGTPHMDPESKGALIGLTLNTTAPDIYRAILEGSAYESMLNIERLGGAGIAIESLRAVGGGAKSDLWLQIKADVTGRTIRSLDIGEAGTLGTMILAGTAVGVFGSVREAAENLVRVKKDFNPDPKRHEIYMEHFGRYKKVYEAMKDIYRS